MSERSFHKDKECGRCYSKCEPAKGPCDENLMITFWLDKTGRWKNCDTLSNFYGLLLTNPMVASWAWLLAAIGFSVLWTILFQEGVFTAHINEIAIRYTLYLIAALSAAFFFGMNLRRNNLSQAFYKLACATKAVIHGIHHNAARDVITGDQPVMIMTHNNNKFVEAQVALNLMPRRIAVTLNALLVAVRHTLRGDLCINNLPLYADQIAELHSSVCGNTTDGLYSMVVYLVKLLKQNGAVEKEFNHDHVLDGLHKALCEVLSVQPVPRIWMNGIWLTQFVLTVFIPLLFSRIYPGYSAIWISPIVLSFYYAALAYSVNQCEMWSTNTTNTWSDVPIARIVNQTANDNYLTAALIHRQNADIRGMKKGGEGGNRQRQQGGGGGGEEENEGGGGQQQQPQQQGAGGVQLKFAGTSIYGGSKKFEVV